MGSTVRSVVATVAPIVGSFFGGPVGAVIGGFVGSAIAPSPQSGSVGQVGATSIPDTGQLQTAVGESAWVPKQYGNRRAGMVLVANTVADKNGSIYTIDDEGEYAFNVYALGEGPWNKISQLYYYDNEVFNSGANIQFNTVYGEGNSIFSENGRGNISVEFKQGTQFQTRSDILSQVRNSDGTEWFNTNDTGTNICYMVVRLKRDREALITDPSPTVFTVDCEGKQIPEVRLENSPVQYSGSGYNTGTNPGMIALDQIRNAVFGAGISNVVIDFDAFVDFANYCDDQNFTLNGQFAQGDTLEQILQEIAACTGAVFTDENGIVTVKTFKKELSTTTVAISQNNVIGGITRIEPKTSDLPNVIKVKHLNQQGLEAITVVEMDAATIANEKRKEFELDLRMIQETSHADEIAKRMLLNMRQPILQFEMNNSGYDLELYGIASIEDMLNTDIVAEGSKVRIEGFTKERINDNINSAPVRVQCRLYNDNVFDDTPNAIEPVNNISDAPGLRNIPAPTFITAQQDALGGAVLTFPTLPQYQVELSFRQSTSSEFQDIGIVGSSPSRINVPSSGLYQFRIRYISQITKGPFTVSDLTQINTANIELNNGVIADPINPGADVEFADRYGQIVFSEFPDGTNFQSNLTTSNEIQRSTASGTNSNVVEVVPGNNEHLRIQIPQTARTAVTDALKEVHTISYTNQTRSNRVYDTDPITTKYRLYVASDSTSGVDIAYDGVNEVPGGITSDVRLTWSGLETTTSGPSTTFFGTSGAPNSRRQVEIAFYADDGTEIGRIEYVWNNGIGLSGGVGYTALQNAEEINITSVAGFTISNIRYTTQGVIIDVNSDFAFHAILERIGSTTVNGSNVFRTTVTRHIQEALLMPGHQSTFLFNPDTNNSFYTNDTGTVTLAENLNANQILEAISTSISNLSSDITVSPVGIDVTNHFIDIDLGTVIDITSSLTIDEMTGDITASVSKTANGAAIQTIGVPTIYTVTDNNGNQIGETFESSVEATTNSDINTIKTEILSRVNGNLQSPVNWTVTDNTGTSDLVFTASAENNQPGLWNVNVNNQGQVTDAGNIILGEATETVIGTGAGVTEVQETTYSGTRSNLVQGVGSNEFARISIPSDSNTGQLQQISSPSLNTTYTLVFPISNFTPTNFALHSYAIYSGDPANQITIVRSPGTGETISTEQELRDLWDAFIDVNTLGFNLSNTRSDANNLYIDVSINQSSSLDPFAQFNDGFRINFRSPGNVDNQDIISGTGSSLNNQYTNPTFTYDPDTSDTVYTTSVPSTNLAADQNATQILTTIGNTIAALETNITFDGVVGIDGTDSYIDIDLGTEDNIGQLLTIVENDGTILTFSLVETNGVMSVNTAMATTYTLTDPYGNESQFTSFVPTTSDSDLDNVKTEILNIVNDNTQSPIDFTGVDESINSKLIFTGDTFTTTSGRWSISVNNHGQLTDAGNINFNGSTNFDGTSTDFTQARAGGDEGIILNPTYAFNPDINNVIYSSLLPTTRFDSNLNATEILTVLGTRISNLETNITWDGNVETNGTNMYIDINLGTENNLSTSLTIIENDGDGLSSTDITLMETNGVFTITTGVASEYTITSPDGNAHTTFTSSIPTSSSPSDLPTVLTTINNAINNMTETPVDFTSVVNTNQITITAGTQTYIGGLWNISVNNFGQSTNVGDISFTDFIKITSGVGSAQFYGIRGVGSNSDPLSTNKTDYTWINNKTNILLPTYRLISRRLPEFDMLSNPPATGFIEIENNRFDTEDFGPFETQQGSIVYQPPGTPLTGAIAVFDAANNRYVIARPTTDASGLPGSPADGNTVFISGSTFTSGTTFTQYQFYTYDSGTWSVTV